MRIIREIRFLRLFGPHPNVTPAFPSYRSPCVSRAVRCARKAWQYWRGGTLQWLPSNVHAT